MKPTTFKVGDIIIPKQTSQNYSTRKAEVVDTFTHSRELNCGYYATNPPKYFRDMVTLIYRPDLSYLLTLYNLMEAYIRTFNGPGFLHAIVDTAGRTPNSWFNVDPSNKNIEYSRALCQQYEDGFGMHICDMLSKVHESARTLIFTKAKLYKDLITKEYNYKITEYNKVYEPSHPIVDQAPKKIWVPSDKLRSIQEGQDFKRLFKEDFIYECGLKETQATKDGYTMTFNGTKVDLMHRVFRFRRESLGEAAKCVDAKEISYLKQL